MLVVSLKLLFETDKGPGQWVRGGGWNNDFWGGDFPTAAWLDDISPDNPVSF
jgi:predicted amidohydrolase YtcJ